MTTTTTESKAWDFTPVLEFLNANAIRPIASPAVNTSASATIATPSAATEKHVPRTPGPVTNGNENVVQTEHDNSAHAATLGNFAEVWQFLGVKPSSAAATYSEHASHALNTKIDYASDGAAYTHKSRDLHGLSLQQSNDTLEDTSDSAISILPDTLRQQRKESKRARKQERRQQKIVSALLPFVEGVVSESEIDNIPKHNAAKKASIHIARSPASSHPPRGCQKALENVQGNAMSAKYGERTGNHGSYQETRTPTTNTSIGASNEPVLGGQKTQAAIAAVSKAMAALPVASTPVKGLSNLQYGKMRNRTLEVPQEVPATPQPAPGSSPTTFRTPNTLRVNNLLPASILPKQNSKLQPPSGQQSNNAYGIPAISSSANVDAIEEHGKATQQVIGRMATTPAVASPTTSRKTKQQVAIEPHVIRSGVDREWALLLRIIENFDEDRKHLVKPANLTTHNNHPEGIHLFVDASNIFLGFMDQLKRSRGIHPAQHLPQANLSFDGLALLMERRRPVAKRILVGSTPHLPAFDKAASVGYDCSILEKVHKSRLLTERQIHFRHQDALRYGRRLKMVPGTVPAYASGSPARFFGNGVDGACGSETNTALYDPPKMIEQGVDEILHLKMLESIVDAERPSTMVLATGDAAEAEYSDGFMTMVERALKKGWKVELISWSKSISKLYTKMSASQMWGDRFRIIYLDDWAEDLLDM